MRLWHATASVYLFARTAEGWRLGMIEHPRLGGVLVPGGHVEPDEDAARAARREVVEETGLEPRFLPPPHRDAAVRLPAGYPHREIPPPWWTVEIPVAADNHHPGPHVHVDHHYLAVADRPDRPVSPAAHPLHWVAAEELPGLDTPLDVKVLGAELFARIDAVAGAAAPAARPGGA